MTEECGGANSLEEMQGLAKLINAAQSGNKAMMTQLLEIFTPILSKYAYLLNVDDGNSELTLAFIQLIHTIKLESLQNTADGIIVNYIARAIRFKYIKLSKAYARHRTTVSCFEDLGVTEKLKLSTSAKEDEHMSIDNLFDIKILSEQEQIIIKKIFFEGYSTTALAALFNISRQAINQSKHRGLRKLKTHLDVYTSETES